jgi:hypothetical protein
MNMKSILSPLSKPKTVSLVGDPKGMNHSKDSPLWNIYRSCRELPLDIFIDVSINGNLSLLDKNYDPTSDLSPAPVPFDILNEVWSDLNLEYTELMDNGTMKTLLIHGIDSEVLKSKFMIISTLVQALGVVYDKEMVDMLKDYGYKFSFDHSQPEKYYKDLSRVTTLSKNLLVQITLKEGEVQKLKPDTSERKDPSIDDWTSSKIALDDDAGFAIDWGKKTVYEYTQRHKNLVAKLKQKIKNPVYSNE